MVQKTMGTLLPLVALAFTGQLLSSQRAANDTFAVYMASPISGTLSNCHQCSALD